MTSFTLTIDGKKPVTGALTLHTGTNLYRVLRDNEIPYVRDVYPAPAMFHFMDATMPVTKQWQFFLCGSNYKMETRHVANLMNGNKFACNKLGLGMTIPRQDWIRRENTTADLPPYFSKVYTCADARHEVVNGYVTRMDGNQPPALKPGYSYPERVEDVNPDAYLYTPRTHPHLFYAAVITNDKGELSPFPNGAVYEWTGDTTPRVFMPLVSLAPLPYPPAEWVKNSARLAAV